MDPDLPDEKDQYIVRFKHGDFFGELGMVMGIPRTATVIADKMSLLITLRKAEFHTFLRTVDIDFDKLMRSRSLEHLRNCYKHYFFDALPEKDRYSVLADYFRINVFEPCKVIFERGQPADKLYIVAYGEVLTSEPGIDRDTGKKGSILGVRDVLNDNANYASTAEVVDRTITLSISRQDIESCFRDKPLTARIDFELKLLREDCRVNHVLEHPIGIRYFSKWVVTEQNQEMVEFWCQVRLFSDAFKPANCGGSSGGGEAKGGSKNRTPRNNRKIKHNASVTATTERGPLESIDAKRTMKPIFKESKDDSDNNDVDIKQQQPRSEHRKPLLVRNDGTADRDHGNNNNNNHHHHENDSESYNHTQQSFENDEDKIVVSHKLTSSSYPPPPPPPPPKRGRRGHPTSNDDEDDHQTAASGIMITIADTIYNKYLANNILGMNVKNSSRSTISKAIKSREYKYNMFATAVQDMERTLSRQSFMRFKRNVSPFTSRFPSFSSPLLHIV